MARSGDIPTNTLTRTSFRLKGDRLEREDLSSIYMMISPTDAPLMTALGKPKKVASAYHEWPIDELADVDNTNARADGADAGDQALTIGHKLGNHMQISDKIVRLSVRAQIQKTAFNKKEMGRQIAKKMKELKRDQESILLQPQAATADVSVNGADNAAAGTIPKTATLSAWIRSNRNMGATGTAPTLSGTSAGFPDAAGSDGTLRALSKTTLDAELVDIYVGGGEPDCIMVSPKLKQQLSNFLFTSNQVADMQTDLSQAKKGGRMSGAVAVGGVDYYKSDFGFYTVIPNRWMRDRDVFLLDKNFWKMAMLRRVKMVNLAKTGDSDRKQIIVDWGLISYNEEASGMICDINHQTAVVA